MAKKRMTPEVAAKLKAHTDAKKGRTTLMGLDRTVGLIGLDWVQEKVEDGTLPSVRVGRSGALYQRIGDQPEEKTPYILRFWWTKSERKGVMSPIRWCRLKRCPEWVVEEFGRRWGLSQTRYSYYDGVGTAYRDTPLVPFVQTLEWFRWLWPNEVQKKLSTYVCGYTDRYIEQKGS